jgi:Zn-dependent protease
MLRMLRMRLPIGRVLGIRLWLHVSWFPVLAVAIWVLTTTFADAFPELPGAERLAMGLVTAVAFFGSLTTHELSHALMARRFGIEVHGITLFLFGGVAEIRGEVPTPAREFAVAVIGPATSIALASLAGLGFVAANAHEWTGAEGVFFSLAAANLGVALFNLVPGLPLDGGRLLRAAVWRLTGSFTSGTRVAAVGGKLLAVAVAAGGAFLLLRRDLLGLWYGGIGAFLWLLAGRAARSIPPAPRPGVAWTREGEAAEPRP